MGCATTLFAALQAPKRIQALVLIHPPTAWETRSAKAGEYELMANVIEKTNIATLVEQARQQPMTPAWLFEAHPEFVTAYLDELAQTDPKQLALLYRGARLCNLPERETLRSLTMPALILAWEGDPGHPLSTAEELARLLPNSHLVIARNMQDLEQWTTEIISFLKNQKRNSDRNFKE
jgi:pimeloyl-ACP methyl ester carboxylesterase